MTKPSRAKNFKALEAELEQLSQDWVAKWIEGGSTTGDMRDRGRYLVETFKDLIERDIKFFGETGKYPKYREMHEKDLAELEGQNRKS